MDGRIGTCTVLASSKWQSLFEECERMLGFSGNAASDVLTAWSRIAAGTFDTYRSPTNSPISGSPVLPLRRASSLNTIAKTVRVPGELISLERARAMTLQESNEDEGSPSTGQHRRTMDDLEASLMQLSIEHSHKLSTGTKIKISGPLHLQDDIASSYPPVGPGLTYSPHADHSPPPPPTLPSLIEEDSNEEEEGIERIDTMRQPGAIPPDTDRAIQKYIDQVRTLIIL